MSNTNSQPSWLMKKQSHPNDYKEVRTSDIDDDSHPSSSHTATNAVGGRSTKHIGVLVFISLLLIIFVASNSTSSSSSPAGSLSSGGKIQTLTWNLAAINNNPFEYWIHIDSEPAYNKLMDDIETFINNPGQKDVLVSSVFTQEMWNTLRQKMTELGWSPSTIAKTATRYMTDFRKRKIISGFLKDADIGKKRLASMPDRVTNTMQTANGKVLFRPTVINCYDKKVSSMQDWWTQWVDFMFYTNVSMSDDKPSVPVAKLLVPIKRAKYPSVTEEEESISLPLQTLSAAIFDAILVHMMQSVAPAKWQTLRTSICEALNSKKNDHTINILENTYKDRDVMFLQEVAASFVERAKKNSVLAETHHILAPAVLGGRDQNSVILLRKSMFSLSDMEELTKQIEAEFPSDKDVPVATGDIFAIKVNSAINPNEKFMLVSFHGDTDGLATIPVLTAVDKVSKKVFEDVPESEQYLVFGLDANTYTHGVPNVHQDFLEFVNFFTKDLGINSCWGSNPSPQTYTTYSARTYLQTQLNKAAGKNDIMKKGDVNPKDFILFYKKALKASGTQRDNTGKKQYVDSQVIPSLDFPSDHCATSTTIQKNL